MATLVWDLQQQNPMLWFLRTKYIIPTKAHNEIMRAFPSINKLLWTGTSPPEMKVTLCTSFSELCTKSLALNV